MKKLFLSLIIGLLTLSVFAKTYEVRVPMKSTNSSCPRCQELMQKGLTDGAHCWRMFDLEKGQTEFMVYHCNHGHTIKVPYNDPYHPIVDLPKEKKD